ncbi:MAG: substrate-binding domain-containing protein [Deltaproteobacteria bacterium]|nr:substrate-binding domain-containing protein [Deltaproteobacteria bacterium]
MLALLVVVSLVLGLSGMRVMAAEPIKIVQVVDLTGPLEAYAKQSVNGFQLGLEYATKGSMKVLDRPIKVIIKDTQAKPEVGKQMLTEAFKDDKADLAVGGVLSSVALAMLPVAKEFKKILIVEPAVADSITGEAWNRYIFRTGRNSSQDAISNAVSIAKPGVFISTLAQDYAFGRDGVKAYKEAAEAKGAKVVHEEYAPINTTDFTASVQRIIQAMKDLKGEKYIFIIWAGKGNPFKIAEMKLDEKYGIKISTGGNILDALALYKPLVGMKGAIYYYYEIPKNPINKWLVDEHQKRFKAPPDFFTCGGFSAAMAVVAGLTKAGSTDTEKLISAMEGLHFQTPKGEMVFRAEDHQALQSMYAFQIKVDPNVKWAIPELVKEFTWKDMQVPIHVKK